MPFLIKNGTVFFEDKLQAADVLIDGDKIKAIAPNIQVPENVPTFDAAQQLVAPGLVDVHVHFRDPGFTYKETIATGSLAAAHGGFTTVCAMPNLDPVPNTPDLLKKQLQRNATEGHVHIHQYAPITKDLTSAELVDWQGMKAAGAFAFSNDGKGVQLAGTMYDAMAAAKSVDLPIVAHVEDNSLVRGGVMNAGPYADKLGLPGILAVSESSQVARDIELAQATGAHYHICHISTAESIRQVRAAKQAGINVSCEVSPHHLVLDDAMITKDDPMMKMNPPLRSFADRQACIEGLLDGTIDCVATDHAPHSVSEKSGSMKTAAFGITGSETAFPILYTAFVKTQILSLEQLLHLMSDRPADLFNLPAGRLLVGGPADIAIFDLTHEHVIAVKDFVSKGKNTPFINDTVLGWPRATFVSGQRVAFPSLGGQQ
ncbi:dihydroorotase [Agrilactobacillus composti DSM 18527 = JCM 14202]|uniref:Dihydroorotase n=1 Tax=Agrilactobacillus composti DSM 18527 = JCM 14202 TaxID=1423734 RepID=X0PHA1_9LACO|nr:dihydroorotase [Agrilactobacillus composti]KRM36508.1 dihydroorotase [Agrilactobacillus composti DSM 18527 = JCM 14202]GAF41363.1 dihydroorotase [Agrilactobacillus composti DSM 18527 = JCM 14202]